MAGAVCATANFVSTTGLVAAVEWSIDSSICPPHGQPRTLLHGRKDIPESHQNCQDQWHKATKTAARVVLDKLLHLLNQNLLWTLESPSLARRTGHKQNTSTRGLSVCCTWPLLCGISRASKTKKLVHRTSLHKPSRAPPAN